MVENEDLQGKNSKGKIELVDELPTSRVNSIYFAMQVVITIIMVVIQTLIQFYYSGIIEAPFTVSAWLLGLSVAYFFYRENEYLYSMILAGFMAMVFVIGSNMAAGTLLDIQHIPILIAAMHIITQKREFDFNVVVYGTIFFFCWMWVVWSVGVAYQYFSLYFMIALSFIIMMNLSFFYAFKKKPSHHEKHSKETGAVIQALIILGITIALIFLLADNILTYWQGWVYTSLSVLIILISIGIFYSKEVNVEKIMEDHMDILPEMSFGDNLLYFARFPLFFVVIIVASLDGGRFSWSPEIPLIEYFFCCVGLAFSNYLKRWAVIKYNEYGGPYRYIRHPGYLSEIIEVFCASLVLGSVWALIPAGICILVLIIRTYREDILLSGSIEYAKFMKKVKYRLIPWIF